MNIVEDITSIMNEHQGDKMQAVTCLEMWRQSNGRFHIDLLLESLLELRRKDIIETIQKYIRRQHRLY